jgi:hypothetical protein
MKATVAILFTTLFFSGCLTDSGESLPEPTPISVNLIKSAAVSGLSVSFVVNCFLPQPCWTIVRTDQGVVGADVKFTVIGRRTTNGPCLDVQVSVDTETKIRVPSTGTYTFHFWQYGGTTIDTTLAIP